MKRTFYSTIIALSACALLSVISAWAVPAPNPETFETYPLGGGWSPSYAVEGWQRSTGTEVSIVMRPELDGQAMLMGYVAMSRRSYLSKTSFPHQVYSVDIFMQDTGYQYSRYYFTPEDETVSKGAGYVDILYSGIIQRALFYYDWDSKSINLPGWEYLTLGAWYTLQMEFDWTINKMRGRIGPTGSDSEWTAWLPVLNVCQPTKDLHSAVGGDSTSVYVDNVSLGAIGYGWGNLDVNVTLDDYTGPLDLVKVKIDLLHDGVVMATRTVAPPAGYTFTTSFTGLVAVDYTVRVESPQWLSSSVLVSVPDGFTTSANVTLRNGDSNGDNAVRKADLGVVLKNLDVAGN